MALAEAAEAAVCGHQRIRCREPGRLVSQSSTSGVVQSSGSVQTVVQKLENLYVSGLGCAEEPSTTQALDFFCVNPSTGKTNEVFFDFNRFFIPDPVA